MLRYKVAGMSCDHCVNRITKAIQSHYPSAKVDIDFSEQTVEVSMTEDLTKVEALIKDAGYEVNEGRLV